MFKCKQTVIKHETEFSVQIVQAEALRITKGGTYVLALNRSMPYEQLNNIISTLKKETSAKWIIIQDGASIVKVN